MASLSSGWLVVLGIVFCVLGLAGQLQWQVLVTGETAHSFVLPDASYTRNISLFRFYLYEQK